MEDKVYIVDAHGDYYKTDYNSGRVVKAEGREDATIFSLKDAEYMISFRDKKKLWKTVSVMQLEKETFKANEVDNMEEKMEVVNFNNENSFILCAKEFVEALADITGRISELSNQLIVEQGKEADLLHHIELHELSLIEKKETYGMLENCLRKRRKIKDELFKLQKIAEIRRNLESSLRYISSFERDRHYNPRQLIELFA